MSEEILHAYPALFKQWKGPIVRLCRFSHKYWPDFGLVHPKLNGKIAWVEVKAIKDRHYKLAGEVTQGQLQQLDELMGWGFKAGLLVYFERDASWGVMWSTLRHPLFNNLPKGYSEVAPKLSVGFIFGE